MEMICTESSTTVARGSTGAWSLRGRVATAGVFLAVGVAASSWMTGDTVTLESVGTRAMSPWLLNPWGWWMGVPMMGCQACLLGIGFGAAGMTMLGRGGRAAWGVLLSLSVALLAVGAWYIVGLTIIQHQRLLRSDGYLLALMSGVIAAVIVLASLPTRRGLARFNLASGPGHLILSNGFVLGAWAAGLVLAGGIIGGSWLGTLPPEMKELATFLRLMEQQMSGEGAGRVLLPAGGRAIIHLDDVPLLGSPQAPHVIYHFYDYTDPKSWTCHVALREARKRYGEQLVVIAMMVPLDRAYNPQVTADDEAKHAGAGEYARLALAVWRADPKQFEAFDDYLLTPRWDKQSGLAQTAGDTPSLEEARAKAAELVGEETLQKALADPWIDRQIRLHVAARDPNKGIRDNIPLAPQTFWLRFRPEERMFEGEGAVGALSSAWLFEAVEKFWGIKPVQAEVNPNDTILKLLK